MKQHRHAEVLRAIADGKEVEFSVEGKSWSVFDETKHLSPLYRDSTGFIISGFDINWRVKPIEEYQVVYSVGEHNYLTHQWYVSKEEFDNFYIPVKGEAKFICFVKETGRERV